MFFDDSAGLVAGVRLTRVVGLVTRAVRISVLKGEFLYCFYFPHEGEWAVLGGTARTRSTLGKVGASTLNVLFHLN